MIYPYLQLTRTVVFSQHYAVKVAEPQQPARLSEGTMKAIAEALGTSDLDYWKVVSDSSVPQPFSGQADDAMPVTVILGDHPSITLGNEIAEVIQLGPCHDVTQHALDGRIESIGSCRIERPLCFKFYVPDLYQNAEFLTWLESSQAMTWHQRGTGLPDEDSLADVTIFVDPSLSGEGSDFDMPGHDLIVERIKLEIGEGPFSGNHIVVVLTNTEH